MKFIRERYASGISDETAKEMVKLLNSNLANLIDLSMDSKQCHWNLQGKGFIGVHQLLDETYPTDITRVDEHVRVVYTYKSLLGLAPFN